MPLDKIGFLYSMRKKSLRKQFNAFYDGLKKGGFIDGKDGKVEYGLAEDDYDKKLPDHAKALFADSYVKVVVAAGGPISAVKALDARTSAKSKVPIVFTTIADPVGYNLVSSRAKYSNPDRNATGTAGLTTELDEARLDLLKELLPNASTIGLLVNSKRPNEPNQTDALIKAAKNNWKVTAIRAPADPGAAPGKEFDDAIQILKDKNVEAQLVTADPFFNSRRSDVIKLAKKWPAIYQWREFAEDGGLISFGPSLTDAFSSAGEYAGRIFKGADPARLPIVEPDPTLLKPVINLKTAEDQSIDIPLPLLGRSEVINEKE